MTTLSKQDAVPKSDSDSPIRTLLLEPDIRLRETLMARLSPSCRTVEACEKGEALIERMQEKPADLVIVDWRSLGPPASSILREIQRINPGAAVILTGEEPPVREVIPALKEGAFDFLIKPYSLKALDETIGQALENRRSFMEILQLSERLKKANRTLKIQKRKLLEEKQALKKWTEEMNLLNAMTREVVSTLDLETILKSAIRHIGELVRTGPL
ncbi:MAG: response regulator [Nitrospirae bacterium]|nr:response regulator [Nitrospirota bacterium]